MKRLININIILNIHQTLTHGVDGLRHLVRFHSPAPVLVVHHEVLLPAVQSREQILELAEAHLTCEVPLLKAWLSFNNCMNNDCERLVNLVSRLHLL